MPEQGDVTCRSCGAALPSAPTVISGEGPAAAPTAAAADALEVELREALEPGLLLLRPLGEGGMGRVYLARDPALKRLVAVKVLSADLAHDATARVRFAREAEAVAAVAHPGVVSVYQVGELPRSHTAYFVMQYVEGRSLQDEMRPGEAMAETRVRRIIGEAAAALAAAHARGLVHRDVKPANIMLDSESGRVVVLDFGISAALERLTEKTSTRLTAEGASIGTPMYMSPEQAMGHGVNPKSDVYSLGVLAFELAIGHPPFSGSTWMELTAAHIKDVPPKTASLRPDLDPQIADLIDRCLEKSPEKRPSAADAVRLLLPSAQTVIEWPPPGLDQLRAAGASLLATMAVATSLGLLLLLMLLRLPASMSPRWPDSPKPSFDGTPIWFFVIGGCFVAILFFLPLISARSWRLADRLRWARRAGYPWAVLLDVAWDYRRDTGDLLSGTGRFALIDSDRRSRLLRARRVQAGIVAATLLLALLAQMVWVAGWSGGWAQSPEVLPSTEAVVLFAPIVLGLLGIVWSGRLEARAVARAGTWWRFRRAWPQLRPELVTAWLSSAGRAASPMAKLFPRALIALIPITLTLGLLVTGLAVILATSTAARVAAAHRDEATALLGAMRVDSLRALRWQTLDSLVAVSARLPGARSEPDVDAAQQLLATFLTRGASPVWNVDTASLRPPQQGGAWEGTPGALAVHVAGLLPAPIAPADRNTLTHAALDPVLPLWRRLARSGALPPLWQYRPGLPGVGASWSLPVIPGSMRAPSDHNLAAGVLALAAGEKTTALLRARENIAVGRQLMRSPLRFDFGTGGFIVWRASKLLKDIGRVTRDQTLVAEAEQLDGALRRSEADRRPWHFGILALMADPAEPVGLRLLADTTRPPSLRAEGLVTVFLGYCANAREVLFGVDPRRRDALVRATQALKDIPRSGELARGWSKMLDDWIDQPADAWRAMAVQTGVTTPLTGLSRLPVIRNVAARLAPCRFFM